MQLESGTKENEIRIRVARTKAKGRKSSMVLTLVTCPDISARRNGLLYQLKCVRQFENISQPIRARRRMATAMIRS